MVVIIKNVRDSRICAQEGKLMERMRTPMTYPNIDMIQTGLKLKSYIEKTGMSVKDIQRYLRLSCPQPIYRWMSGKILPSVDHLLMLSELFGVHMEELLVKKQIVFTPKMIAVTSCGFEDRITLYYKKLAARAA